jgi:NADPH:quinone reductase-like Zn-dependent oxidoreductase
MKAAQINNYGGPDAVVVQDAEKPSIQTGMVLVEVYASSLNPFDTMVRDGKTGIPLELPATLGGDLAGIISEVGEGVSHVKPGDKIFGQANAVAGNSGAWAEFALTKGEQVSLMPSNVNFSEAAVSVLVGVSALQAITEELDIQQGQKLLIQGGAGGIGAAAVQIAKKLGAYVAVTVSTDDVDYAKALGADEVIDYKTQKFQDILKDYDAVFDSVGGDVFVQSYEVLKQGGKALSMIAPGDEAKASEKSIISKTQSTKINTERLNKLRELIEAGTVSVRIDSTYPLEQIKEAFEKRESGTAKGKVALEIKRA